MKDCWIGSTSAQHGKMLVRCSTIFIVTMLRYYSSSSLVHPGVLERNRLLHIRETRWHQMDKIMVATAHNSQIAMLTISSHPNPPSVRNVGTCQKMLDH
jgi:hypothetical protein